MALTIRISRGVQPDGYRQLIVPILLSMAMEVVITLVCL